MVICAHCEKDCDEKTCKQCCGSSTCTANLQCNKQICKACESHILYAGEYFTIGLIPVCYGCRGRMCFDCIAYCHSCVQIEEFNENVYCKQCSIKMKFDNAICQKHNWIHCQEHSAAKCKMCYLT